MGIPESITCERVEQLTLLKDLPSCKAGAVVSCFFEKDNKRRCRYIKKEDKTLFEPYVVDGYSMGDAFGDIMRAYKMPGWVERELEPKRIISLPCPKCWATDAILAYEYSTGYDDGVNYFYIHPHLVCTKCGHSREVGKKLYRTTLD